MARWGSRLRPSPKPSGHQLIYRSNTARRLRHDRVRNPSIPLGCNHCPHLPECGGLNVEAAIWNCLDFCCGQPGNCDRVCRNNHDFASQFNEAGGFNLLDVAPPIERRFTPSSQITPLFYHASSRLRPAAAGTVSLRLSDLYSFNTGQVKFKTRQALCDAFKIRADAEIILSGVDHDRRIEPWWKLDVQRIETIKALKALGIDLVTTPNFSLILDRPRMDDLHAMKRIGIIHEEFCRFGLTAALHVNGRTDRDFERWTEFLVHRPTIHQLAFEFSTGNGTVDRLPLYTAWLTQMASAIDRPLDIFVRGNPSAIPALRAAFENVFYIETTSFMRTTKRRRAERSGNQRMAWPQFPTSRGQDLSPLLDFNTEEQAAWLSANYFTDMA